MSTDLKICISRFPGIRGLGLCLFLVAFEANAIGFDVGNLLVQWQTPGQVAYQVTEYRTDGTAVQTFDVPQPPGQTDVRNPRDLAFDSSGDLQVYNGTFDPYLSSLDTASDSWTHRTAAGWSTVNNVSFGGLATYGNLVFVTDMRTFGSGDEASGIIMFDLLAGTSTRFAEGSQPIDLNIGLDGLLYVLEDSNVSVYDPNTLGLQDSIRLITSDTRTIAADADGNLYAGSWNGVLDKYNAAGTRVGSILTGASAIDLDVSVLGLLALGTRLDGVLLSDTSLSGITTLASPGWNHFVTFVTAPVPLPPSALMLGTALAGIWVTGRKRQRKRKAAKP